ncbi:MAG: Transcription termination protein NusB, partial [uncultured Thermoleophilia bacterium]
ERRDGAQAGAAGRPRAALPARRDGAAARRAGRAVPRGHPRPGARVHPRARRGGPARARGARPGDRRARARLVARADLPDRARRAPDRHLRAHAAPRRPGLRGDRRGGPAVEAVRLARGGDVRQRRPRGDGPGARRGAL